MNQVQVEEKYLNKKFGRLTVTKILEKTGKYRFGECICGCGNLKTVRLSQLGIYTKSCGCLNKEVQKANHIVLSNFQYKYTYNEDFFKTLTEESAYVLGYLYADGCLGKNKKSISITSIDIDILSKISLLIRNTEEIKSITKASGKNKTYYHLNFTNKEIYRDLLSWGLYPNKSLTLTIPEKLQYNKHFWRGMIDGDGWVFKTEKSRFVVGLCGTLSVCESFKDFCKTLFEVDCKININSKSGFNHRLTFSGTKAIFLHKHLYENAKISMDRKNNYSHLYDTIDLIHLERTFKVKQLSLDMKLIQTWDSAIIAANELNISKENIQSVLGNSPAYTANGFKWEYVHKPNQKYYQTTKRENYRGVSSYKGKYICDFVFEGVPYSYRNFDTAEQAAKQYDKVMWKFLKRESWLNFEYPDKRVLEDFDINQRLEFPKKNIERNITFNGNSYVVIFKVNKKSKYFGSFKTIEEAITRRNEIRNLMKDNTLIYE